VIADINNTPAGTNTGVLILMPDDPFATASQP
jgi:hypothetical protein